MTEQLNDTTDLDLLTNKAKSTMPKIALELSRAASVYEFLNVLEEKIQTKMVVCDQLMNLFEGIHRNALKECLISFKGKYVLVTQNLILLSVKICIMDLYFV